MSQGTHHCTSMLPKNCFLPYLHTFCPVVVPSLTYLQCQLRLGCTVPQKRSNDPLYILLRYCFFFVSPKCINRQLVGFSYFITKTIIQHSRFYPKNLVEKRFQQIFKLFINKLGSISQNYFMA